MKSDLPHERNTGSRILEANRKRKCWCTFQGCDLLLTYYYVAYYVSICSYAGRHLLSLKLCQLNYRMAQPTQ